MCLETFGKIYDDSLLVVVPLPKVDNGFVKDEAPDGMRVFGLTKGALVIVIDL